MPRLRCVWILALSIVAVSELTLLASAQQGPQSSQQELAMSRLYSESEFRLLVNQWRLAQEGLLQSYYQKSAAIVIEAETSSTLIQRYLNAKLSPEFFENKDISRIFIKEDLGLVLHRAFSVSVKRKYKSLAAFILDKQNSVAITSADVNEGIALEDCNIIPCPPDKCKPDCSKNSFRRFTQ